MKPSSSEAQGRYLQCKCCECLPNTCMIDDLMRDLREARAAQSATPANARAVAEECVRMVLEYDNTGECGDTLKMLAENMNAYAATLESK